MIDYDGYFLDCEEESSATNTAAASGAGEECPQVKLEWSVPVDLRGLVGGAPKAVCIAEAPEKRHFHCGKSWERASRYES